MRRILVENARRKHRLKYGGGHIREAEVRDIACPARPEQLLSLDEALERLAMTSPQAAELVKLRYFAGLTLTEAASALGISIATAGRHWRYARAWLTRELRPRTAPGPE